MAVLPVVLFHAKVAGFSGGFVGVDIFYVISGYLITSLIADDIAGGRFSFVSFYERRLRRIFPALFAVLFTCILVALVLLVPRDFLSFGKSLIAVALFGSNLLFERQAHAGGYFDRAAEVQVLLHTWSLSVEEQFYLFFPTTLILFAKWKKEKSSQLLFLLAIVSFVLSVWLTRSRPHTAFYNLVPRAWELLMGALLALRTLPPIGHRWLREAASTAGLGLVLIAVFTFTRDTPFPGMTALLPCAGAWLIIYAGESGSSWTTSLLSFSPLVFVGVISYSFYLWHWPLIVFSRYFVAGDLTGVETAAVIAASLMLAVLSYKWIEAPFRGRESRVSRREIFVCGLGATALTLGLGVAIYASHGFPGRYSPTTARLISANTARSDDFQEVCTNWKTDVRSLGDINFCNLGSPSARKIMFWGDSHVQQLYPLIKEMYDNGDLHQRGAVLAIGNACLPAEHLNTIGKGYHCDSFAHFAMIRAEQADIETVFIAFNTWWAVNEDVCASVDGKCVARISPQEAVQRFLQEFDGNIRTLRSHGKRVIISLPFPMYDKSIPEVEMHNAIFGRFGLTENATDITLPSFRDRLSVVAQEAGANIFDPRQSLCPAGSCVFQSEGVSIYKDDNHIAASQIGIFQDALKRVLQ